MEASRKGVHSPQWTEQDRPERERWAGLYGELVAQRLEPGRRYLLMAIGDAQFAYTDSAAYLRALGRVWNSGHLPEPLPSALGRELPEVAPALREIDRDFGELRLARGVREERRVS